MNIKSIMPFIVAAVVGCSSFHEEPESIQSISQASHAWADYHWFHASNPLTITLSRNLTAEWVPYLDTASTDWNLSSVLDTTVVLGSKSPKTCKPTLGRVEVCNSSYGKNGWLGIAQVWISGGHISQGVVKLNDSYFKTVRYNTVPYRNLVMCQEIGHTFGLDHQDENQTNSNLGTCMDYTSNPAGPPSNEHPNTHDYEELDLIYSHVDSLSSSAQTLDSNSDNWGELRSKNSHSEVYVRNLGQGNLLLTHVLLAE